MWYVVFVVAEASTNLARKYPAGAVVVFPAAVEVVGVVPVGDD